jgi:hypothetical protein
MTKLERLKIALTKYNRTKSISQAADICNWLAKELLKPAKNIPVTHIERVSVIEVRKG